MKPPEIPTTPTDSEPAEKAGRGSPLPRLVLALRISWEVLFTILCTPLVILLGGVFQTWDEWGEMIQEWKREWNDQNDERTCADS
jgi:hypothetical protein